MATTDFGALSAAKKKIWAAETWKEGRDQSFWFANGFVGKSDSDMNRPVHRITKLTKTERGTECVMQLVSDLLGDGVVADNELEGNEESLVNSAQTIRVDQLRHGVKSAGEMSEQETVIRFRAEARMKLSFWIADKMDELGHLTIAGRAYTLNTDGSARGASQLPQISFASDVVAASTNRIMYAGAATSEATLTASDTVDWNLLVTAKTMAKRKRLRPIRQNGKEYYAIVLSTEQMRDLLQDTIYQTIVSRAGERGSSNPLFKNATAVVQGVILYDHNKIYTTQGLAAASKWGAGGNVEGAQAQLFGAQAMGFATIGDTFTRESDNTDYGNRPGLAYGRKFGVLKPQFPSRADGQSIEDFGTIAIKTAAAA